MVRSDNSDASAVAALSAILKASSPYTSRPRIRVSDLLSSASEELQFVRVPHPQQATATRSVLPQPTPVPVALHRLSKERVKLAPLHPNPAMATTDHHHQHPLPRLAATPTATPVKPASSVVLIDDDHPMLSVAGGVPKPRPAKRTSDDYKHSHMLAERKRRKEMKGVFDQLAALLPPTGPSASKRSKWETLVDTIDYLDGLEMRKRALITKIKAVI